VRILLVEPDYRRNSQSIIEYAAENSITHVDDESLWYPPIGLLKLARFHKIKGDSVKFVYGCVAQNTEWDRIYITTLFTYNWDKIIQTIEYYEHILEGDKSKIFVGGIMASLLARQLKEETGVNVITGVLNSPYKLRLSGRTNIDR
jgi:hypothetical protein